MGPCPNLSPVDASRWAAIRSGVSTTGSASMEWDFDGQDLAGELVDHVEHLHARTITVVSNWTSIAHTTLGRIGDIASTDADGALLA